MVAGFFVEYDSMSFALFFLGEYANSPDVALTTILFLDGWYPPLDIAPLGMGPRPDLVRAEGRGAAARTFIWVRDLHALPRDQR